MHLLTSHRGGCRIRTQCHGSDGVLPAGYAGGEGGWTVSVMRKTQSIRSMSSRRALDRQEGASRSIRLMPKIFGLCRTSKKRRRSLRRLEPGERPEQGVRRDRFAVIGDQARDGARAAVEQAGRDVDVAIDDRSAAEPYQVQGRPVIGGERVGPSRGGSGELLGGGASQVQPGERNSARPHARHHRIGRRRGRRRRT